MNNYYEVHLYMDDIYEVVVVDYSGDDYTYETVFKGSLADCESYIRLKEGGYM